MPLNVPRTLQTVLTSDTATSRVFQNVKSALDPVLSFVNGTFALNNDGTVSFLRQVKSLVATNFKASFVAADILKGNQTFGGAINGSSALIFGPIVSTGSITGQTVSGSSVSSSTGFKTDRDMGYTYASAAVAGTRYQSKRFTQSDTGGATFSAPMLFQPLFAGSIIGVHGYSLGTAGGNYQIQLWKNATQVPASGGTPFIQTPASTAGQYFGAGTTYTRGINAFSALDYFSASATFTAAGNQHLQIVLTVEYNA